MEMVSVNPLAARFKPNSVLFDRPEATSDPIPRLKAVNFMPSRFESKCGDEA
jgi:hypothetical protein